MTIVVSGVGVVSNLGVGAEVCFQNLLRGDRGRAGPIFEFDAKTLLGQRGLRHFDRTSALLASAAVLAVEQSGVVSGAYAPEQVAVVVGATHGSIDAISQFDQTTLEEGLLAINPQSFCNTVINAPASRLSILFGLSGPNYTLSSGSSSFFDALAAGVLELERGRARAVICGSGIGYSAEIAGGYERAQWLDPAPALATPFARRRSGVSLSEGAAVVILERLDDLSARSGTPLARIAGVDCRFSPEPPRHSRSGPDPDVLVDAMRAALDRAALEPHHVSALIASASGCPDADETEAAAISSLFRPCPPTTAPKCATGECLEASGAMAVAFAVAALESGLLPAIAGLDASEVTAPSELDLVTGAPRSLQIDHVLVSSIERVGHAGSAVISRI